MDESAEIDGANSWRILWNALAPWSKPAATPLTIFSCFWPLERPLPRADVPELDSEAHHLTGCALLSASGNRGWSGARAPVAGGRLHGDPSHLTILRGASDGPEEVLSVDIGDGGRYHAAT